MSQTQNSQFVPEPPDRHERFFRTDHLAANLQGRSARGGAVTIGSQAFKFVVGMFATVVLARLLTPQDYGLVGMVYVVTGFISMYKDLGLSVATIQKAEINHAQISTLFWINIAISIAIMLITALIAPLVAWFYNEPRLTLITIAFGSTFVLGGLTVQHQALLQRQMRFTTLAVIDIAALLGGIVAAIISAWHGAGYWALVINNATTTLVNVVGVWIACGWRPGLPSRTADVRSMLAVGGGLTGFTTINYFARNLDNALIGRFWGAYQLGLYAKAYQLLLLPIDQINGPLSGVVLPALSRLADSPERYRQAYLRILEKVTMLTLPGVAFMIATSDWLVQLVLGSQWTGVSLIFSVLGIAGLVQPITNTVGWLFMSQGRTQRMFFIGTLSAVIAVISICIGLPWGALGVAISYASIDLLIRAPLNFWLIGREGPVRTMDFYRASAPAMCAAVCVLLALFALRRSVLIVNPIAGLSLALLVAGCAALAAFAVLPQGRRALLDFKTISLLLLRKNQSETKTEASHKPDAGSYLPEPTH